MASEMTPANDNSSEIARAKIEEAAFALRTANWINPQGQCGLASRTFDQMVRHIALSEPIRLNDVPAVECRPIGWLLVWIACSKKQANESKNVARLHIVASDGKVYQTSSKPAIGDWLCIVSNHRGREISGQMSFRFHKRIIPGGWSTQRIEVI